MALKNATRQMIWEHIKRDHPEIQADIDVRKTSTKKLTRLHDHAHLCNCLPLGSIHQQFCPSWERGVSKATRALPDGRELTE